MTREDAVTFLKDREQMHRLHAEKIAKEYDIIEDEVSRSEYNAAIDLANKYACIATMVK